MNRKHRQTIAVRTVGAILLALLAAGCSEPPTETNTIATPETDYPRVSICYSASNTTREALAEMALELCPKETRRVEVWDHDTFFNDCPINKKNRVTYRCIGSGFVNPNGAE